VVAAVGAALGGPAAAAVLTHFPLTTAAARVGRALAGDVPGPGELVGGMLLAGVGLAATVLVAGARLRAEPGAIARLLARLGAK
jgi:hypothetical protein